MSLASSLRTTSHSRFPFALRSKHSETTTRTYAAVSALGSLYADGCAACRWNEWIVLPIRYCDLPLSAQVTFTVWDIAGPRAAMPVGGSTFRLFGKKWCVHSGLCVHCAHPRLHAPPHPLFFCTALQLHMAGLSAGVNTAFCCGLGLRRTARSKPLRRANS